MRRSVYISAVILAISITISGQDKVMRAPETVFIELITPWVHQGQKATYSRERASRSCFDLGSLTRQCHRDSLSIRYGDRMGVNWDLFNINGGRADRTRMVEIGKYKWTDRFTVPYVEPWAPLLPGERRSIKINASGGDGAAGEPGLPGVAGMNGDGTYTVTEIPPVPERPRQPAGKNYAIANVKEQVSSTVKGADGSVRGDTYTPVIEAKLHHMYVVRVIDETRDHYLLIRIDELERGERVVLSYIKLDVPKVMF